MQKLLPLLITVLFWSSLAAQHDPHQPFDDLGLKVGILTLSEGKYQESFPNDTIFRFGSVLFNHVTGEIVMVVENDTLYGEYDLKPEVVSRWLSLDPMAAKYPNWSPYNYVGSNPVIYIDPDGRDLIFAFKNKQTKKEDRANLENELNEGLGGYYTANISKKGEVTLTAVEGKDISEASEQVKGFYDVVNQAVSAEGKVKIKVFNGEDRVVVGSFDEQAIDMEDLNAFNSVKNTSGVANAVSVQSKLAHEISEQFEKQINRNSEFMDAHTNTAIPAENRVSGSVRKEDLQNLSMPNLEIRPTVFEVDGKRVIVTVKQDGHSGTTTVTQKPKE